jgi:Transposase DDE domain
MQIFDLCRDQSVTEAALLASRLDHAGRLGTALYWSSVMHTGIHDDAASLLTKMFLPPLHILRWYESIVPDPIRSSPLVQFSTHHSCTSSLSPPPILRRKVTSARIEETLRPAGLDWITALRAPQIRALAAEGGPLQSSLFDQRDLAEITSPDYPGERLVVCKNPLLAEERARKREELLQTTEKELHRIQARVERPRKPLHGSAAIGQAVGAVIGRRKMAKHFQLSITEDSFNFSRNETAIAAEAALDGIYVLRTNLSAEQSDAPATVRAYKSLAHVEHAFRSLKTVDLELRPVFHWTAPRVRGHVLLCMLAYYVEWNMRQCLAPILFDEHDPVAGEAQRVSPVQKARPSPPTSQKAASKYTDAAQGEPIPVHSFHTLLADLATLTRNVVRLGRDRLTTIMATPTKIQRRAFELLAVAITA